MSCYSGLRFSSCTSVGHCVELPIHFSLYDSTSKCNHMSVLISVVYNDFTLLATVSNQKVYIIKKENEIS